MAESFSQLGALALALAAEGHLCSSQMPGLPKGTSGKWKNSADEKLGTTHELQAAGKVPGSRRGTW